MQRGTIYKHHGSWLLRYYDEVLLDGKPIRKRATVKLAPVNEEYPSKRSVLLLAEKHLALINSGQLQPESAVRLADYIENIYLPAVEKRLRNSTVWDYKHIFKQHLKSRIGDLKLRDFRTVHAQRILHNIPNIGHARLLRIKAVLSAVFTHAIQTGVLDGPNPIHGVSVPGKPTKFRGYAYSLDEIENMFVSVTGIARVVIAVAALTGLRLSELRGLRWSDFDGENLHVRRAIWRTHVGPTKTDDSEGMVPVLPLLQKVLEKHRGTASETAYIFAGKHGAPLNLHNLAKRTIQPAFAKWKEKSPSSTLEWKGWHAFRRGLASNLYALGVQPKVIAAILRHSDIGTTLQYYVQSPAEESRAALRQIEDAFPFGL